MFRLELKKEDGTIEGIIIQAVDWNFIDFQTKDLVGFLENQIGEENTKTVIEEFQKAFDNNDEHDHLKNADVIIPFTPLYKYNAEVSTFIEYQITKYVQNEFVFYVG